MLCRGALELREGEIERWVALGVGCGGDAEDEAAVGEGGFPGEEAHEGVYDCEVEGVDGLEACGAVGCFRFQGVGETVH